MQNPMQNPLALRFVALSARKTPFFDKIYRICDLIPGSLLLQGAYHAKEELTAHFLAIRAKNGQVK